MTYSNWELILVDNGSQDESVNKFKTWIQYKLESKSPHDTKHLIFSEELLYNEKKSQLETLNRFTSLITNKTIKLIRIEKNCGFTGGNNIALEYISENMRTDYILLLNNDVIVEPSFLDDLISTSEKELEIGVIGPTIYYYSDPQRIQSAGYKIEWKKGKLTTYHENNLNGEMPSRAVKVDTITGCAIMAKIEIFLKIGFFKPKYFAYWEDVEWCTRAKEAGYPVAIEPKVKLWHKQSLTSKKMTGLAEYHFSRNRLWFMREHASRKDLIIFLVYFFFYEIFRLLIFLIIRKRKIHMISYYFRGIWDGIITNYD